MTQYKHSLFAFLFVLAVNSSCNYVGQPEQESKLSVFSTEEQSEIRRLVSEFDQLLINYTYEKDTLKAYKEFLLQLKHNDSGDDFEAKIKPFATNARMIFNGYEDKQIFNQLWEYSHAYRDTNPADTLWVFARFAYEGKYMDYLKMKSSENEFFSDYYQTLQATGSNNTPVLMNIIPLNIEAFDLTRIEDRFVIAMHYISLSAIPLAEQGRTQNKEVNKTEDKYEEDSIEQSNWSLYEASLKIENYVLESTPNEDILTISQKAIIFVSPDSIEVDEMIREIGDDFYIVADDNNYYNYEAAQFMEEKGIELVYPKQRYIKFHINKSKDVVIDTKAKVSRGWTTLIFRPDSLPKVINPVDIDIEYKLYFGK